MYLAPRPRTWEASALRALASRRRCQFVNATGQRHDVTRSARRWTPGAPSWRATGASLTWGPTLQGAARARDARRVCVIWGLGSRLLDRCCTPGAHRARARPVPRARRSAALLQLLCAYADRYNALLEGRCEDMSLSELHGGARIRWAAGRLLRWFGRSTEAGLACVCRQLRPAPTIALTAATATTTTAATVAATTAATATAPTPTPTITTATPTAAAAPTAATATAAKTPGTCSSRFLAASCARWTPRATWATTTCAPPSRTAAAPGVSA